jgi:hypothetical protein
VRSSSLLLGALFALGGCATQHRLVPADTPLQQAVRFVETDGQGHHHDLSGSGHQGEALLDSTVAARRVPDPGLVGMESTLQIRVDPTRLGAGSDETAAPLAAGLADLDAETAQLRNTVAGLTALAVQEAQLVRMFSALQEQRAATAGGPIPAPAWAEWKAARRTYGAAEDALISVLLAWEETDPEFAARLDAVGANTTDIVGLLQGRLDSLAGKHAALTAALAARSRDLTLEAWWLGDDQRGQLHLPYYDDLDAGDVVRRDRAGLELSADDRARLEAHWQATVALAGALEEYRQGRGTLREAVAAAAPALVYLADELQAFREALATVDMAAARREARAALDGCLRAQGQNVLAANAPLVDKWAQRVDAVTAWLAEAAKHADSWRSLPPAEALAQIDAARDLTQRGAALLGAVRADLATAGTVELPAVLAVLAGVEQVPGAVVACWREAAFAEHTTLGGLWIRAESLLDLASGVYGGLGGVRLLPPLETDTWRVPVEAARSTSLDLTRSPHRSGDRVVVRARLWRGEAAQPDDELVATFAPQWFGWHGRLSPAVVLARPDRLPDGRTPKYGFAPVLSWLQAYTPRPEQDGAAAGLARALVPSLGIHAAFLNADPDAAIEVGLGATLALWGDRLQLGGGMNLMAADDTSGRYYSFVGSDLISLLNAAGLGSKP